MRVSTGKLKKPQGSQGLEGSFQLRDSIAKWGWGGAVLVPGPGSQLLPAPHQEEVRLLVWLRIEVEPECVLLWRGVS